MLSYAIFFEDTRSLFFVSPLNCIKTIYLAFDKLLIHIYFILSTTYVYTSSATKNRSIDSFCEWPPHSREFRSKQLVPFDIVWSKSPPNAERNERVSTKRRGATNGDSRDAHVVNYDVDMPRYCSLCRRLLIRSSHTRVSSGLRLSGEEDNVQRRLFWQNRPHLGEITSQFWPRGSPLAILSVAY